MPNNLKDQNSARSWLQGWRDSMKGRLQIVGGSIRQYPSTVIAPALVLLALLVAGLAAVLVASNAQVSKYKDQAEEDASTSAELIGKMIHEMMEPIHFLGLFVKSNPNFSYVAERFHLIGQELVPQQLYKEDSTRFLALAPMANITDVYPENILSMQAIGLDLLTNPIYPSGTIKNLQCDSPTAIRGPFYVNETTMLLMAVSVIFIPNVTRNESFGIPESMSVSCPSHLEQSCYKEETGSKFWGYTASVGSFGSLVSASSPALSALSDKGYSYMLVQASPDLPATPGVSSPSGKAVTVLAQSATALGDDPISATVHLQTEACHIPWVLMITRTSVWEPDWRNPLIAMVVIVSMIIAALLFMLLLYMRQHQMLLYSLMPRNVVKTMFEAEDFGMIVNGQNTCTEAKLLQAGTPVEQLINMLSQLVRGSMPDMKDIISVRAALINGGHGLFQPKDLKRKLQANPELEDDVVNALVRELQGISYVSNANQQDDPSRLSLALSAFLDVKFADSITSVLSYIMKQAATLEDLPSSNDLQQQKNELVLHSGRSFGHEDVAAMSESQYSSPTGATACCNAELPTVKVMLSSSPLAVNGERLASNPREPCSSSPSLQLDDQQPSPKASPVDKVITLLEASYGAWTFDAFALEEASEGHPLSVMLYFLLARSGLISTLHLNPVKVARLSMAIENGYLPNPYHNKAHAADVLQTMFAILVNSGMVVEDREKGYCNPLTLLSCILAAAAHDLGHIGVTNDFLIQSEDDLATLYSDKSPMEHHHLASLFTLLKKPQLSILSHLSKEERATIRKIIIELVCATDMKNHFTILSQFSTMHQLASDTSTTYNTHQAASASAGGSGRFAGHLLAGDISCTSRDEPRAPNCPIPLDEMERLVALQVVLKCADLGSLAETMEVNHRWVESLENEFFEQGDRERSLGLTISPLFDRNKPGVSKSQIGFYDFVAFPLFHNLCCVFPGAKPLLDLARSSYRVWKVRSQASSQAQVSVTAPAPASQQQ